MCGICAVIMENSNKDFPIGCLLFKMMESQQIRAQDSTGVAIFNNGSNKEFYKIDYFKKNNRKYNPVTEKVPQERLDKVLYELSQDSNVVISSFAKEMNLVKDTGLVRDLDAKYKIRSIQGTHGIGHLRIATSSRVTPDNAHPFSTTIMPDIAVVHNGEIANYSKLKSSLELQGYHFYSRCDSEVIAVFINKADCPFTYIVSTPNCLALVRDRFGARKGIFGYNPGTRDYPSFWAIATDLSALDCVGANLYVETSQPGKPKIFYKK